MFKLLSYFGALLLVVMLLPSTANAGLCIDLGVDGYWKNVDRQTRGITKLRINFECRDASRVINHGNGISSRTSAVESVYRVSTWGKCHPNDCSWGQRTGEFMPANRVDVKYAQGFADKFLKITKIRNGRRAGQLRVHLYNRFKDNSGRRNYSKVYYFRR